MDRTVFPLCYTLTGSCSPYATHSQGQAAQLPEQGEAFIYLFPPSPLLVSVRDWFPTVQGSWLTSEEVLLWADVALVIVQATLAESLPGWEPLCYIQLTPPLFPLLQDPQDVLFFMPTFISASSGLEVLASAAMAQLPSAQGDGSVSPSCQLNLQIWPVGISLVSHQFQPSSSDKFGGCSMSTCGSCCPKPGGRKQPRPMHAATQGAQSVGS